MNDRTHFNPEHRFHDNITAQEVYDHIVYHLGTMPEQSVNKKQHPLVTGPGRCSYRSENGNSCPVGYLYKDSEYHPDMEGNTVTTLTLSAFHTFPHRLRPHLSLLKVLQSVHDSVLNWRDDRKLMWATLVNVAASFGLNATMVQHPDMIWNRKYKDPDYPELKEDEKMTTENDNKNTQFKLTLGFKGKRVLDMTVCPKPEEMYGRTVEEEMHNEINNIWAAKKGPGVYQIDSPGRSHSFDLADLHTIDGVVGYFGDLPTKA